MTDVLDHLHSVFQNHADVDVESLLNVEMHAYSELELSLIKLEHLTNTKPAAAAHYQGLFDQIAEFAQPFLVAKARVFSKQLASGTAGGGGGGGGSGFRYGELDMSVYEKMAESTSASFKDTQMVIELKRLVLVLQGPDLEREEQQFFRDSCLLPLLKSQLRSASFSGLAARRDFFKYVVHAAAQCFGFPWLRESLPFVMEGLENVARSGGQFLKVARTTGQGDPDLIGLAEEIIATTAAAAAAWAELQEQPLPGPEGDKPVAEDAGEPAAENAAPPGPEMDQQRARREGAACSLPPGPSRPLPAAPEPCSLAFLLAIVLPPSTAGTAGRCRTSSLTWCPGCATSTWPARRCTRPRRRATRAAGTPRRGRPS
jgi:hypothetical protein